MEICFLVAFSLTIRILNEQLSILLQMIKDTVTYNHGCEGYGPP